MLFHVDMMFIAKQAKRDLEKSLFFVFSLIFPDDATTAKCPRCDEGTNLRLRAFAVVHLMPTRGIVQANTN